MYVDYFGINESTTNNYICLSLFMNSNNCEWNCSYLEFFIKLCTTIVSKGSFLHIKIKNKDNET